MNLIIVLLTCFNHSDIPNIFCNEYPQCFSPHLVGTKLYLHKNSGECVFFCPICASMPGWWCKWLIVSVELPWGYTCIRNFCKRFCQSFLTIAFVIGCKSKVCACDIFTIVLYCFWLHLPTAFKSVPFS